MPKVQRKRFRPRCLPKQLPYNAPVLAGEHLVRMGVKTLIRRLEYLKGCLSNLKTRRVYLRQTNLRETDDKIKEICIQIDEAEREMDDKLEDELEKEFGFRCEKYTNKVWV